MKIITGLFVLVVISFFSFAQASDLVNVKIMKLELAQEIAQKALNVCRKKGYQVTVVVADRTGAPQVMLRDVYASYFSIQLAQDKANAVSLSGVDSGEFRKNRKAIRQELNHVDGVIVLEGAIPIRVAGSLVGVVSVSGAPGGDIDKDCAQQALAQVQDRLEFSD